MSGWGRRGRYKSSGYPRYVPVAERRAKAEKKAAKLEKAGRTLRPVEIEGRGRAITTTFWGKAWCKNLEAYSDYANRLPRGRTYARNGSVIDLQIAKGQIDALVNGSDLYTITLKIDPLPEARWKAIRDECAGQIKSLVELLQGTLSQGVMEVVTRARTGLFPSPREIHLDCSCPDWAVMCKHVAAALYGVGARLDQEPEMLFLLRGVDPAEMIDEAIRRGVTQRKKARGRVLKSDDLSSVFGVDIDFSDAPLPAATRPKPRRKSTATGKTSADESLADLPTKARGLLDLITKKPDLRSPSLAIRLGVSLNQVAYALRQLKERGLIEFVGSRSAGGYRRIG